MAYTLDGANRIRFATHSSGASLYGQSFNSLGQRGKLTWGGSVGYTWDHAGRLGTMTDDLAGAGNDITWTFSYSPASQVVSWSATSTAYDYREYATASVGQSYDGLNRGAAIVSAGGYDLRGNMIKDATRVMSYDAENRFLARRRWPRRLRPTSGWSTIPRAGWRSPPPTTARPGRRSNTTAAT
ncbi:MAG: hypothetical protein WDN06_05630 [Asticcacaulis sp.]